MSYFDEVINGLYNYSNEQLKALAYQIQEEQNRRFNAQRVKAISDFKTAYDALKDLGLSISITDEDGDRLMTVYSFNNFCFD